MPLRFSASQCRGISKPRVALPLRCTGVHILCNPLLFVACHRHAIAPQSHASPSLSTAAVCPAAAKHSVQYRAVAVQGQAIPRQSRPCLRIQRCASLCHAPPCLCRSMRSPLCLRSARRFITKPRLAVATRGLPSHRITVPLRIFALPGNAFAFPFITLLSHCRAPLGQSIQCRSSAILRAARASCATASHNFTGLFHSDDTLRIALATPGTATLCPRCAGRYCAVHSRRSVAISY